MWKKRGRLEDLLSLRELKFLCIISYILIDIKSQASIWISDNIKKIKDISKDNGLRITNFINRLILLDKFIFFGEFIMIIRCVLILLEIN